jgi:hypothetical protein
MSEAIYRFLAEIAETMSTPERKISLMQVAAHLLEEAIHHVPVEESAPRP